MLIIRSLIVFAVLVGGMMIASPVVTVRADSAVDQSTAESCKAINDLSPSGSGSCSDPDGQSVNSIIKLALNILSVIAGIVAVVMMMVAGLKYTTSQGDSNQISSAKQALLYVVIGLVIVAFAQLIVQFVLAKSIN